VTLVGKSKTVPNKYRKKSPETIVKAGIQKSASIFDTDVLIENVINKYSSSQLPGNVIIEVALKAFEDINNMRDAYEDETDFILAARDHINIKIQERLEGIYEL
jgi:hypothetical protein